MPIKDTFLAGILAHVPEAERGKAETAIEGLEANGLRQSDYSKLADEAKAAQKRFDDLYASNTEWFEEKKAALAEVDALRAKVAAGVKEPVVGDKPVLPEGVITKKEVQDLFDTTERGAVAFIAEANALTMKHFKEFGDILNITDLLADKRVQQIGLAGVYADKFKDQISAKTKAADDARADSLRKEGYDKARTELANRQQVYPVTGNDPSALDAIEEARAGKTPAFKTVDQMADEFARLSAKRAEPSSV